MLHRITEQYQRVRRQFIEMNAGTNKKVIKPNMRVQGNNNHLSVWPDGSDRNVESDGLDVANTILKDGSDLLGAPSRFLNTVQQNWLVSLVLIAIILVCILILYFIIKSQCSSGGKLCAKKKRVARSAAERFSSNQTKEVQPMLKNSNETLAIDS